MSLLRHLEVTWPIRVLNVPDGSRCLHGITSEREFPTQVSLNVVELGLGIHGPQSSHGLSHGNTPKGMWGNVGGPSSIAEGVSELKVGGGGKSASRGEVGGL